MGEITNLAVEESISRRLKTKGERYGIDSEFIERFYREGIIPLTKELEVEYLLRRTD